jgi:predicted DNA binding CopG/RHH family protein
MERNKRKKIPEFKSLEEFQGFWDKHDLTEFWDKFKEVSIKVDLKRSKNLVTIDPEILKRIRKTAAQKGLKTESLINIWLQEKILKS